MTLCDGNVIGVDDLAIQEEGAPEEPGSHGVDDALDAVLESVEKETILNALEQSRWNKTAAAKLLGISFGALRYRMQKLGLD
jgi:two-component system response regulator PilR (NtrC family)